MFLFNWKQSSLFLFMDMKVIDMSCLRAHYLQQQYYNAFAFCSGLSITQGMTRLHKVKLYKVQSYLLCFLKAEIFLPRTDTKEKYDSM